MILGMSTATFSLLHTVLSLVGIGSGFVVVFGLLTARRLPFWTFLFMTTTALAILTGFLFPFHRMTLTVEMGIPVLAVLMLAAIDRYTGIFAGMWRHTYVVSIMIALYCSIFVMVAQLFAQYLAPTAREPDRPGLLLYFAQIVVFAVFAALTPLALRRFQSTPSHKI